MTAITRLYDQREDALRAVRELEAAGIDHDRISLVSNNADDSFAKDHGHLHDASHGHGHGDNDAAEGAGKGAATGGVIGGVGGLLAGLGMLAIPGLGPVVAAGWLASTAAGAAVGAIAGGATGGLLGALKDAGHSDEEAHVYSEGVRRGGTLVSVRADDAERGRIEAVLDGASGVSAADRGEMYRASGWSRFDESATPYTRDEILAERRRYGESRTFATDGSTDRTVTDERDSSGTSAGSRGGDFSRPIPGTDV